MIIKDYSKDALFDELGLKRLKESYMMEHEQSPQDRLAFVSEAFGSDVNHAQRLYNYASKHWLSYSTPILAFGRNKRGMPISCFLNHLEDTSEGLVNNLLIHRYGLIASPAFVEIKGGQQFVLRHLLLRMLESLGDGCFVCVWWSGFGNG